MAIATSTAIALAVAGAKAGTAAWQAKKQADAAKKAAQLSPAGQQAQTGLMNQASLLNKTGGSLLQRGDQALEGVQDYWTPLLRGDRAAIDSALAPDVAGITDVYRGANKNLDRAGVRGAQRDVATSELTRQRAGQIALLRPQMRAQAAGAMGELGINYLGQGAETLRGAGQTLAGVYQGERGAANIGLQNYLPAQQANSNSWMKGLAGLAFDVLDQYGGSKGRLPTSGRAPNFVPYRPSISPNRP